MNHPLFSDLARVFSSRQRFLLVCPAPDGDSVGCVLALKRALELQGKEVTAFAPDPVPSYLHFLPGIPTLVYDLASIDVGAFDAVVICDAGDLQRSKLVDQLLTRNVAKTIVVNIDHHQTRTTFQGTEVTDLSLVSFNVASTTELLFHFMRSAGWEMDKDIATCLLTGILTDTGSFQNLATTAGSLEAAAHLCSYGANIMRIGDRTIKNKTLGILKLWGRALSRLSVDSETGVVTTAVTQKDMLECGVDEEGVGGIANFLNNLDGAKATLVLREEGGNVKGSYRTTQEGMDVAALAERYGGGGHKKSAGFIVPGRLEESPTGWKITTT